MLCSLISFKTCSLSAITMLHLNSWIQLAGTHHICINLTRSIMCNYDTYILLTLNCRLLFLLSLPLVVIAQCAIESERNKWRERESQWNKIWQHYWSMVMHTYKYLYLIHFVLRRIGNSSSAVCIHWNSACRCACA